MKRISIKHIANVHSDAIKALELYIEELSIFQERLEDIAGGNTGSEVSVKVEHFQNQFLIHKEKIGEIKHRLHENLHTISANLPSHAGFLDETLLSENFRLNEEFLEEEKLFREMKNEFYQFAAKWM